MATFNAQSNDMFDLADDVDGLTFDELRDLPYQMQIGLDLTTFE